MMSDVQVSNTRRIFFTALALVTFWVMACSAYWIGFSWCYAPWESAEWLEQHYGAWSSRLLNDHLWVVVGPTMALLPTLLMWISVQGFRSRVWVLTCGLLFAISSSFIFLRAWSDYEAAFAAVVLEEGEPESYAALGFLWVHAEETHVVSWLWLLLPIILTTAFVIVGVWRRAVRDAEVEVVVEAAE